MNSSMPLRGFSLIETCLTLAIISLLMLAAAGNWRSWRQGRQLESATKELLSDLHSLRSDALARAAPMRIELNLSGSRDSCYVIHNGASGDCTCSATAGTAGTAGSSANASQGSAQCKAGVEMIKVVGLPAERGTLMLSRNTSLQWSPMRGTVSPTATLKLLLPDGRAIHHVVNILGRVRSCSPDSRMPGYAPC